MTCALKGGGVPYAVTKLSVCHTITHSLFSIHFYTFPPSTTPLSLGVSMYVVVGCSCAPALLAYKNTKIDETLSLVRTAAPFDPPNLLTNKKGCLY